MSENCTNCKRNLKLVKFDYSEGGCVHTDYDGYACMALASEQIVVHMIGLNPEKAGCEMYIARLERDDKSEGK